MSDRSNDKNEQFQDQAESLREQMEADLPAEADHESENQLNIDELNYMIEQLCCSKVEEYKMLGYQQIDPKEIWECVASKYKNGYPALHAIVNDILSLKPDKFMNWVMMQAYKTL